jgi:hypothetical protein
MEGSVLCQELILAILDVCSGDVVVNLRLCCKYLIAVIPPPLKIPLCDFGGVNRYIIYSQRGPYKVRQYYVGDKLNDIKITDGVVIKTLNTKHCLDNPYSDTKPRFGRWNIIPRDSRVRMRTEGNSIVSDYYISKPHTNPDKTGWRSTTKSLVHIKSPKSQIYKVWFETGFKIFEFDDSWNITKDVYDEKYTILPSARGHI